MLAAVAAEILLRGYVAFRGWTPNCYVSDVAFFVPSEQSGYTLKPNLRVKSTACDVQVNSFGFRGPELSTEKPPGRVRIAVMGGSSVFGYLASEGLDSCRLLEQRLRDSGLDVEVINAGVPGYNMYQCRQRLTHQVAPLSPDFVVLYLGWNDLRFLVSQNPEALLRKGPPPAWTKRLMANSVLYGLLRYRLFPPAAPRFALPMENPRVTSAGEQSFASDFSQLIEAINRIGAHPVLSTQLMAANSECEQLEIYLGQTPGQIAGNQKLGQWISNHIRQTAEQRQIPLIDCGVSIPCNPRTLGDAIHPTELGHGLIAETWFEGLQPLVVELEER